MLHDCGLLFFKINITYCKSYSDLFSIQFNPIGLNVNPFGFVQLKLPKSMHSIQLILLSETIAGMQLGNEFGESHNRSYILHFGLHYRFIEMFFALFCSTETV